MHLFNKDKLRLLITDACNLSCSYCHNEGQFGRSTFMPAQSVRELAGWLQTNEVTIGSLIISGGEPSIHPQLLEIVECLRQASRSLSMVTNGIRLTPTKVDALSTAGMKYIKFGIDAVTEATTKGPLLRNTRDVRSSVLETALYASEVMPGSHLNTVVSSFNWDNVPQLVEWCDKNRIGVKFLELIEVRPEIRAINPLSNPKKHAWFAELYSRSHDLLSDVTYNPGVMKFYAQTAGGQTVQFSENFCRYGACSQLWTRIDSHSRLIPCIHSPQTRLLTHSPIGYSQVAGVNQEMTETNKWPCGLPPSNLESLHVDLQNPVHVTMPDGSIAEFALTTRSGCI